MRTDKGVIWVGSGEVALVGKKKLKGPRHYSIKGTAKIGNEEELEALNKEQNDAEILDR